MSSQQGVRQLCGCSSALATICKDTNQLLAIFGRAECHLLAQLSMICRTASVLDRKLPTLSECRTSPPPLSLAGPGLGLRLRQLQVRAQLEHALQGLHVGQRL